MHTPDSTILGGGVGLFTPGSTILGGKGTGGGGNTTVIDLTTSQLDSRLTYTGPAHYYWTESGILALSAENEWPLEYADGVVVGRHEPEPAATNYQTLSRGDTASQTPAVSTWRYLGLDFSVGEGPDGLGIGAVSNGAEKYAIYNDTAGSWILEETTPARESGSWQHLSYPFSLDDTAVVRTYTARKSSAEYLLGLSEPLPTGQYAMSMLRRYFDDEPEFWTGWVQVENGTVATSPIVTDSSVASRAKASVTVDTSAASSITVRYSNGDENRYSTPGSTFSLPVSTLNWSERYVKEIELEQ